nr:MAG TPA: hypothetical protein [Caudoviricetes sp.]
MCYAHPVCCYKLGDCSRLWWLALYWLFVVMGRKANFA